MGRSQYEDNQITVEPVLSTIKFIHNTIELKYIVTIVFGNIIMFMPFGFLGWILPGLKDLKALLCTLFHPLLSLRRSSILPEWGYLR